MTFVRGKSGNPAGRPKGARGAAVLFLDKIGEENAGEILRAVIAQALGGNTSAAELVLSRAWPPRKGRAVVLPSLPLLNTPGDLMAATARVAALMAEGTISPDEAAAVCQVLDAHRRAVETSELAARVAAIEERMDNE